MAQERTLDVAELIEGRKLGSAQIWVALLLCTLMALEGYDMQTLSFAAPSILQEWGVSRAAFGYVLTAHLLGYLVGAVFLTVLRRPARAQEHHHRRRDDLQRFHLRRRHRLVPV